MLIARPASLIDPETTRMRRKTIHVAAAVGAACVVAAATASYAQTVSTTQTFVGNAVVNSFAAASISGWQASSAAGPVTVGRATGTTGIPEATTAIDLFRASSTGGWADALGDLTPSFITKGGTYRVQMWARDLNASGRSIGVLLANGNYNSRPSTDSKYAAFTDTQWHLISMTFVASNSAAADTKFYLGLPTNAAIHWQVTGATVSKLQTAQAASSSAPSALPTVSALTPPSSTPSSVTQTASAPAPSAPTSTYATASASNSAAATTSDPSARPAGDLPGWRQVFTENFDTAAARGDFPGSAYSDKWGGYDGFSDTSGHGTYSPSKVLSVSNGALNMFLHTENGRPLVAAPVPLVNGKWGGQVYGRFSVRFKADALPGYKIAFLLWPDSNVWDQGEVDYPEGQLNGNFYAASLRTGTPSSGLGPKFDGFAAGTNFSSWHTATTEWSPGKVEWFLDGKSLGSTTTLTPTSPMHMVLQAETMDAGAPSPAPSVAGNVSVDWVSISTKA